MKQMNIFSNSKIILKKVSKNKPKLNNRPKMKLMRPPESTEKNSLFLRKNKPLNKKGNFLISLKI
jgi:hypothetical protein